MKYALFFVIMNMNAMDDGVDSWHVIDGNLSLADCFREAMDPEKEKAARTLFGPETIIRFQCDIDHAPDMWQ